MCRRLLDIIVVLVIVLVIIVVLAIVLVIIVVLVIVLVIIVVLVIVQHRQIGLVSSCSASPNRAGLVLFSIAKSGYLTR